MGDIHHMSAIRIGNRIIYNGVNGDAFSFGETASTSSSSNVQNKDNHSTFRLSTANGFSGGSSDTSTKSSKQETGSPFVNTALARRSYDSSSETESDCQIQISLFEPISAKGGVDPSRPAKHKLRLQLSQSAESIPMSAPFSSHQTLHPVALGLPPILPPPPAAHLPPPLPSRPPSAVPSPSSSLSSLLSFKHDDKSLTTPPSSPTQSTEMKNFYDDNPANNAYTIRNFFRSSGTIKVEAPSRDLPYVTSHPPLSPPPLPLPVPPSPTSQLSSTSPSTVLTPEQKTNSQDHDDSPKVPSATPTILQSQSSATSSNTTSSTSTHDDSEEEATDFADSGEALIGVESESSCNKTSPEDMHRQELVAARDGEKFFPKKQTKLARQSSDVSRNIFPPEFDSIRQQSITYTDVITNVLMFYKLSKGAKKKIPYVPPKLEKAPMCRKCGCQFGIRHFRYHCSRCKKSFCDSCIPVMRVYADEQEERKSSLSRVCDLCSEEIAYETSRGTYRGLWSEFKIMRDEARAHRGLDVTSSNVDRSLESQTMLDVTPGLMSLCMRFLVSVHQDLEKQPRHKFLANYLTFESSAQNRQKTQVKMMKIKECRVCNKQLRMMTDIRDCDICGQTFCMNCTYKTFQLYLPSGTDLKENIHIDKIKFHVKATEQDEIVSIEAIKTYRVCAECEDDLTRNLSIHEFNKKIPLVEAELFDLQRQIDHALTFATNIKLANQLYSRYMKTYDNLERMVPQTSGQKALHKHIKQAMYEFYLKRRNQLITTPGCSDSWTNVATESP